MSQMMLEAKSLSLATNHKPGASESYLGLIEYQFYIFILNIIAPKANIVTHTGFRFSEK